MPYVATFIALLLVSLPAIGDQGDYLCKTKEYSLFPQSTGNHLVTHKMTNPTNPSTGTLQPKSLAIQGPFGPKDHQITQPAQIDGSLYFTEILISSLSAVEKMDLETLEGDLTEAGEMLDFSFRLVYNPVNGDAPESIGRVGLTIPRGQKTVVAKIYDLQFERFLHSRQATKFAYSPKLLQEYINVMAADGGGKIPLALHLYTIVRCDLAVK